MTRTLSSIHLRTYLETHAIPGEILHLALPTPTVESAAQAVNAQVEQIVKSILFLLPDRPVLAVTCGMLPIERRSIAAHCGVGRKRVKLAEAASVLAIAGYAVGAMPPFGHRQPLYTLLDPQVLSHKEVFAGGGEDHALLHIDPQYILQFSNATTLNLHTHPSS